MRPFAIVKRACADRGVVVGHALNGGREKLPLAACSAPIIRLSGAWATLLANCRPEAGRCRICPLSSPAPNAGIDGKTKKEAP
jgi:hypothetical protein